MEWRADSFLATYFAACLVHVPEMLQEAMSIYFRFNLLFSLSYWSLFMYSVPRVEKRKQKEGTFCSDLLRMAGPCFLRFLSGRSRLPNSTANLAPNAFSVTSLRLPHTEVDAKKPWTWNP